MIRNQGNRETHHRLVLLSSVPQERVASRSEFF